MSVPPNHPGPPTTPAPTSNPGGEGARYSRLLSLGLARKRPVDQLIERLSSPTGPEWLMRSLAKSPFSTEGVVITGAEHAIELDSLVRLKDRSKKLVARGEPGDEQLRGLLGYFVAVAFGLSAHGKMISSYPAHTVREALIDLAGAMPEPWRSTFESAVERAMAINGG